MDSMKYGYMTETNNRVRVGVKKGQNIAGFPIGIIYIEDVWYPYVPGNVVNGYTYDFPVRLKAVKGLDVDKLLFRSGDYLYESILTACKELEQEGVRAISGACGFFGNFQDRLAADCNVPVGVSSLVQLPWIQALLKPGQKIGVLTASADSISEHLFAACGVSKELQDRLVIRGLGKEPEFSCIIEQRGEFDNGIVRDEVVAKVKEIVEECPDVGAILLECSDMPPYAWAVQAETGLPVFDFITLIKWLHSGVCQTPYCGFM